MSKFKEGDRVVPKLDYWKQIQASYKKYYNMDLPEDPLTLVVNFKTSYGDCNCRSLQKVDFYVTIHQDNLLNAP